MFLFFMFFSIFDFSDILLPAFMQAEQGQKQSSLTTIFSIWNTMIGSSLLALPVINKHK